MNLIRKCLPGLPALAVMFTVACTTPLQVEELPNETALEVSKAPFWSEISNTRSDDWFYLLNIGEDALEWRLRMIDSARVSIDMEAFLWKPDESGRQIMLHILAAADRGVKVRFLLDDSFTMHEGTALHTVDEHPNISFRLYNPFHHRSDSAAWRELFNIGEFSRINHRMHNKEMVVDGRAALIGGRNLADEYFGLHEDMNFRDMEVIAVGASVPQVIENFDLFWNSGWAFPLAEIIPEPDDAPSLEELQAGLAADTPLPVEPDLAELQTQWQAIARVAYTGRADFFFDQPASDDPAASEDAPDQLAYELVRLIDGAESEVIMVSAYLVPSPEWEAIIERAEARGVQVRILTNSLKSNNHLTAHAAYEKHVSRLIEYGAELHEVRVAGEDRALYMRQPVEEKELGLHAKLLLIDDDISFVGSCNLDPRSLKINTEVGLIIDSVELNRALREMLSVDFEPRNAWAVQQNENGKLVWISDDEVLTHQPASSIQRLEDWFLGLLPIDAEM